MNPPLQIPHGSFSILHQEKGRLAPVGLGLSSTQLYDSQEQVPSPTDLRTRVPAPWGQILHQAGYLLGFQQRSH